MMNDTAVEKWQVETNGQVFDTDFAEMAEWIGQGSLLRQDKVRKGNLRWIEAGKVPSLLAVFNAVDSGEPLSTPVVTTTQLGPTTLPDRRRPPVNPTESAAVPLLQAEVPSWPACGVHPEVDAAYTCETCFSQFCRACPSSYGGSVKICPMCGAMCSALPTPNPVPPVGMPVYQSPRESFGINDFITALGYPLRFKTSLVLGAVMYMIFSLGQSGSGFGGIYMISSSIFCFMLANTLTFGVLSNTVENFSQGKIGGNFMPSFDDFSMWDDVVQPFFLSIGVYISSFGPLIAVIIIAFYFIAAPVANEMNSVQSESTQIISPELPYAAKATRQSEEIKQLLNKQQDAQTKRVAALNDTASNAEQKYDSLAAATEPDQAEFDRVNTMMQEQQKAQLESVVGKAPETKAREQSELIRQILAYGALFLLIGGVCLAWGLFYFPAACTVAGYTQSFSATLNPGVGIDTIRRLGVDYVKILLMSLLLLIMSSIVGGILSAAFAVFDLPGIGNLPAKAISSLFGFYISVVFSCVIGFALFKGSDRLKLFR